MITHAPRRGVLFLVILCTASMVYYDLGILIPRAGEVRAAQGLGNGYSFGADFYPIWLTSRESLLHHRDPYGPEMTREIQIGLFGRPLDQTDPAVPTDPRSFANPAFAAELIWPLALLPFASARIILVLILPAVTAFSIVLWLSLLRLRAGPAALATITFLTLSSYAVLEGLFAEQMGLFVGFLLAASMAAITRGRLFLSGSLLALTLVKPQMTILVAAYLLLWSLDRLRARRAFIVGFFLMLGLLGTSSLLVWPHWISEWLQVVSAYRQYSTPPLVCYLLGNSVGSRFGPILIAALLVMAIALAWRIRRASTASAEFALTVSLLLAVTAITLLPGQAVYDHIVLLPGILLVAFSWRRFASSSLPVRLVLGITALGLFWQWICAPVVIAMRPLVSRPFFYSMLLPLPIRTAASIPFGILALLGLMMWQRTRKPTALRNEEMVKPVANHPSRICFSAARFFAGRSRSAARPSAT